VESQYRGPLSFSPGTRREIPRSLWVRASIAFVAWVTTQPRAGGIPWTPRRGARSSDFPGTRKVLAGELVNARARVYLDRPIDSTPPSDAGVLVALVVGLAVGAIIGGINGFLVAALGANALIVTLGMASVISGLRHVCRRCRRRRAAAKLS
jgi:ribose/xylose/arabinose/galactoside ABC-type transport system permease subunit